MQSSKFGKRSGVFVDIFDSASGKQIAMFDSIYGACDFIVDIANKRLGRQLKKNSIRSMIGHESRGVLKDLGFKTVCSFKCDHCEEEKSGRPTFYDPEGMRRNLCKCCHSSIERDVNDY